MFLPQITIPVYEILKGSHCKCTPVVVILIIPFKFRELIRHTQISLIHKSQVFIIIQHLPNAFVYEVMDSEVNVYAYNFHEKYFLFLGVVYVFYAPKTAGRVVIYQLISLSVINLTASSNVLQLFAVL